MKKWIIATLSGISAEGLGVAAMVASVLAFAVELYVVCREEENCPKD